MILGLDISSSVIGVTILSLKNEPIYFGYIDLRTTTKKSKEQFQDIFDKLRYCIKKFEGIKLDYPQISEIHIEEALSKFTPGKSSIQTMQTLFKMNYILSYELYKMFGIKPIYWHPSRVRSVNGLKIPRGSNTKELVLEHVKKLYSIFKESLPKKLPKSHVWLDVADSMLIARAGYLDYNERHGTPNSNSDGSAGQTRTTQG